MGEKESWIMLRCEIRQDEGTIGRSDKCLCDYIILIDLVIMGMANRIHFEDSSTGSQSSERETQNGFLGQSIWVSISKSGKDWKYLIILW